MRKTYLKFSVPSITQAEIQEVVKTLKSGWLTTGKKAQLFEEKIAHYVGAEHGVSLASGTAALFLSLIVEGVQAGDEVVTTPFTFISTANVIHHLGAVPVFADIDPETWNIDPEAIAAAVTSKTRAVIPVALFRPTLQHEKHQDLSAETQTAGDRGRRPCTGCGI